MCRWRLGRPGLRAVRKRGAPPQAHWRAQVAERIAALFEERGDQIMRPRKFAVQDWEKGARLQGGEHAQVRTCEQCRVLDRGTRHRALAEIGRPGRLLPRRGRAVAAGTSRAIVGIWHIHLSYHATERRRSEPVRRSYAGLPLRR